MKIIQLKRSFWDYLFRRPRKVEVKFFDPLKIKVNATVRIDTIDLRHREFSLDSVSEYTRHINGKDYIFTDYNLFSVGMNGEENLSVKLRIVPTNNRVELGHDEDVLVLLEDYRQGWEQGLHDVIMEARDNKVWEVTEDESDGLPPGESRTTRYFRLNNSTQPYDADVGTVQDEDRNGVFDENEISASRSTYLDFGREVEIPGSDQTFTEFYFVEFEKDLRGDVESIVMWKGTMVNINHVTVV